MTIVGTRPELIKMSRVIEKFDEFTNHVLVHTGQNYDYELNEIFFNDLRIRKPDFFLSAVGSTAAETIGQVIAKSDEIMRKEMPDALLLYGDTNSCLSVISAKRLKIPVFHMEAGNRCFDQRVPEELNRKIVDHLSDINLVLSEHARRYLVREGVSPETIIKTGSHLSEVLEFYGDDIKQSKVLNTLGLSPKQYFLVSMHREENVDSEHNLRNILDSLNLLATTYKLPVIVSTHPRTSKRLEMADGIQMDPLIHFSKPFGFFDYIQLQLNAFCVLSDSGTITEESALLKFPAVTIREVHERPEGMDSGILVMSGLQPHSVLMAVRAVTNSNAGVLAKVSDYESSDVSSKVLRIVLSYTNYINQTVWRKNTH